MQKTVAFFHISSSGYVVARKSGDYVTKMLELAGGNYVFDNLGDPETRTSTVTIEMEQFFATAKYAKQGYTCLKSSKIGILFPVSLDFTEIL